MILIVDDDKSIADILRYYLTELNGKEALVAHDVQSALSILEKHKPDIILLDYYLKNETSEKIVLEVLNRWKGKVKIVLMTAATNAEEILKLLNIHFILKKPFDFEDLSSYL